MTFIFISAAVFATDCVRKHVHALSIISTISASPTFFHYMLMSDHMQSSCCTIYNKTHCKSLQHFFAWVLLCDQIILLYDMIYSTGFWNPQATYSFADCASEPSSALVSSRCYSVLSHFALCCSPSCLLFFFTLCHLFLPLLPVLSQLSLINTSAFSSPSFHFICF